MASQSSGSSSGPSSLSNPYAQTHNHPPHSPGPTPSSSAVTIPVPGKSILKKPPPVPQGLFSRFTTRFLPGGGSSGGGSTGGSDAGGGQGGAGGGGGGSGAGGGGQGAEDEFSKPLKRAHFILPQIAIVYPISSVNPPSTPGLKEEKRMIEERERERRRRVVRNYQNQNRERGGTGTDSPRTPSSASPNPNGDSPSISGSWNGSGSGSGYGYGYGYGITSPSTSNIPEEDWWTLDRVSSFYTECCLGCEEPPDPLILSALRTASSTRPRTLDLSGVQLTSIKAQILSDVFSIEWGMRKLVLRECDLDERTLKPVLHALLITDSLGFLSVASNRRLGKSGGGGLSMGMGFGGGGAGEGGGNGWRLVGAFVKKAKSLHFLDVSQNVLEKKSVEYLVAALGTCVPSSSTQGQGGQEKEKEEKGLVSLRMDDCSLRPAALETLCRAVRTSSLKNISLRHNKISASGGVALALMIRDYPDVVPAGYTSSSSSLTSPTSPSSSYSHSSYSSISSPSTYSSLSGFGPVPMSPTSSFSSITSSTTSSGASSPRMGSADLGLGLGSAFSPPGTPRMGGSSFLPGQTPTPTQTQISTPTPTSTSTRTATHAPTPTQGKGGALPPPPPRHPTALGVQTTYTPYVPRSRRGAGSAGSGSGSGRSTPTGTNGVGIGGGVPLMTTSAQGGVTTRHVHASSHPIHPIQSQTSAHLQSLSQAQGQAGQGQTQGQTHSHSASLGGGGIGQGGGGQGGRRDLGPSAALLDKVRALDSLPRIGSLRTLDLKGNDLRTGVSYLAQVLKRNRTLKVLNLSENKLDVGCLVMIADALKYNSCLETLDLNKNPCSGPGLEGIQSLRTAFTLNTSLKRLFLSSTNLTSAGAIALAEFLPESTSLLHLDLTGNGAHGRGRSSTSASVSSAGGAGGGVAGGGAGSGVAGGGVGSIGGVGGGGGGGGDTGIDLAGVMALSKGLQGNRTMRCLDLDVPPGDEAFARMCREILNTCIRNTEEAERMMNAAKAGAEGGAGGVSLGKQTAALLTPRSASTFQSGSGSAGESTPTSSSTTSSDSGSISEDSKDKEGEGAGEGETEGVKTPTLPHSHLAQSQTPITPLSAVGGKVLKRGVWGMIEDSELARRIRMDEERESGVVEGRGGGGGGEGRGGKGGVKEEEEVLDKAREFIRIFNSGGGKEEDKERLVREARQTASSLSSMILNTGTGEDPARMEKLLEVNDELLGVLNRISTTSSKRSSTVTTKTTPKSTGGGGGKPNLKLEGLGVDLGLGGDGRLDGFPELNMNKWRRPPARSKSKDEGEGLEEEEEEVTTPRVDKGKGRAEDPRMGSETMLSPKTFRMVGEGEDDEGVECVEGEGHDEGGVEGDNGKRGVSPLTISRYMVEEEGEVFRKGAVLLGPEEMEGEYAGEELRKELLEAMVERAPPRPTVALTVDDFTLPIEGIHHLPHSSLSSHPHSSHSNPHSPLLSPHPHLHSPLAHSPLVPHSPHSLSHTTSYSPGPSSPSLTPGPPGIAVSGFRSDTNANGGGSG